MSLDFADSGSVSGIQAVAVETCECPWGYSGTSCEVSTSFMMLNTENINLRKPFCFVQCLCIFVYLCVVCFVYFRHVSQVSTGWAEFCLEETVCSVNVMTTPPSATSMEFVW